MMIAFGFAGAAGSWVILVALVVLFAAIYVPTIQGEEAYLREKFAGFEGVCAERAQTAAAVDGGADG